jgi:hypothetical protein
MSNRSNNNDSPSSSSDEGEIQLQQGTVKSLHQEQHQIPQTVQTLAGTHQHDALAMMKPSTLTTLPNHLQTLAPFHFLHQGISPLLMTQFPAFPMNLTHMGVAPTMMKPMAQQPQQQPVTPQKHVKSEKSPLTPYTSSSSTSSVNSPSTPNSASKQSPAFFSGSNRLWKITDVNPELQSYLGDEKFDVKITMKIRGEEACQYVPDKLYSSHKYVLHQELEVGHRMRSKYPLLVSKIKVIHPVTKEEITNSKTPSKEIVKGDLETALTLHNAKSGAHLLQGQMKVQFTDVSYHHDKGVFAMVLRYFDPTNLDNILFAVSSPEFKVYARKPTHAGQTETLKPGKPKPSTRKRKKPAEESTPKSTPATPNSAKRSKSTRDYDVFLQKLEELSNLKDRLSDDDKRGANDRTMEKLIEHTAADHPMELMNPANMMFNPNLIPMNLATPPGALDLHNVDPAHMNGGGDEDEEEEEHHHHHHHHEEEDQQQHEDSEHQQQDEVEEVDEVHMEDQATDSASDEAQQQQHQEHHDDEEEHYEASYTDTTNSEEAQEEEATEDQQQQHQHQEEEIDEMEDDDQDESQAVSTITPIKKRLKK